MSRARGIAVCGAGLKASLFVESLLERGININSIATYPQETDHARSFERLRDLAMRLSINLVETRHPVLQADKLTFLVGWQHLLAATTPLTIVFHDFLLPRYRGFAPTVTALIKGDNEIGVTAFSPSEALDAGPIIAQRALPVSYPIKIEAALQLQAGLMVDIAVNIVEEWRGGALPSIAQRENMATFSIWRDDADYEIDWSNSVDAIQRFVNAVGYPYAGARTTVGRAELIRVSDVTVLSEMHFELREAGKIWRLDNGRPVVICGSGMLRIDKCHREDGSDFLFQRLRGRLGPT